MNPSITVSKAEKHLQPGFRENTENIYFVAQNYFWAPNFFCYFWKRKCIYFTLILEKVVYISMGLEFASYFLLTPEIIFFSVCYLVHFRWQNIFLLLSLYNVICCLWLLRSLHHFWSSVALLQCLHIPVYFTWLVCGWEWFSIWYSHLSSNMDNFQLLSFNSTHLEFLVDIWCNFSFYSSMSLTFSIS